MGVAWHAPPAQLCGRGRNCLRRPAWLPPKRRSHAEAASAFSATQDPPFPLFADPAEYPPEGVAVIRGRGFFRGGAVPSGDNSVNAASGSPLKWPGEGLAAAEKTWLPLRGGIVA